MSAPWDSNWWYDQINYPNDADGNNRYPPVDPRHPHWQRLGEWTDLGPNGEALRSEGITWVWIHPSNGRVWHLEGPRRGREGVALATELTGVLHPDFDTKYSEGPYIVGARPERTDWHKRTIHLGVWIQPNGSAQRASMGGPFALRMIEDMWWQSWSETVPGYLGCFTRTHGWRWIKLVLGEAPKPDLSISPNAHGNNTLRIDMTCVAPWPFYAKRALAKTWSAHLEDVNEYGVASGMITLPNRGTWHAYPKVLIRGAGQVSFQDGIDGDMIQLPKFYDTDGDYMMVDTDPSRQTITTAVDQVDDQIYKYMRNSQLLEVMMHDFLESKLPAQRRIPGGIGFSNPIPPRTVANLHVTHSNLSGSVTMIMPQPYRMSWS